LLIVFAFKTPLPLPEELGVVVDFGGGGEVGSSFSSADQSALVNEQDIQNVSTNKSPLVTQDIEQTDIVSSPLKVEEKKPEPTPDPRVSSYWQNKPSSQNQGDGSGVGAGTGNKSGSGSGSGSGVGSGSGSGKGPGFDLYGRSAKSLPVPEYTEQEDGVVVVEVWVDRNGNVTNAIAGVRGTTISNQILRRKAHQAAMQAKFSANANAPEEQKGTITYTFLRVGN
jgi:TonB family protein